MLLHGVIDSPDIPLNVSRSYLQSDANVKKISSHITKKVAEKLEDMFKNNREDFEKKWDDLKVFLQYGSITDEKFYDRIKDIFLLKNIENQYFTIEEYKTKISALQKDKNDTLIYLYSSDTQAQHLYIDTAKEKGYDVLLLDGFLDTHFINMLETKLEKTKFSRVDADIIDKIIEKDEIQPSKLAEKEQEKLKKFFQEQVDEKKFSIQIENLSETDLPIIITQNEFMRRFQDMEKIAGQQKLYGQFEHYNLIVNANHNLATKILNEKSKKKRDALVQQLIDLSLLSQNILTGEKLSEFVKRSIELL